MRFFNTAGPIVPERHYYIPTKDRINVEEILHLIDQMKYFILHAPRQSGKTTTLLALMKMLNESGKYKCLYVNVESAQAARENVEEVNRSILEALESSEDIHLKEDIISKNMDTALKKSSNNALVNILKIWTQGSPLPTVLLIDEIDSLVGDGLISVLRQLRSRYADRPSAFPQSVILCGVRDIKDYRIHSGKEKEIITGGSCFNIKAKSLTMKNFTLGDVRNLYQQHTKETGQTFTNDAIERSFDWTNGQPWLVNALAYETCFELPDGKDRKTEITSDMIDIAKESLIKGRVTHLDQLADKLKEDRLKNIIGPMIAGDDFEEFKYDDIEYAIDLGLIIRGPNGLEVSNKIYKEVIPRELSNLTQTRIESKVDRLWFVKNDATLDVVKLLEYFQEFFRENSEIWIERFDYKEAGPQLLLQAYLQRVVNGGGRIFREYGLSRKRTDLLVEWKDGSKFVIELKILHKSIEKTIEDGLKQTWDYMDRTGTDTGHLIVFNRNKDISWDDKIFREEKIFNGKKIVVWGC